MGVGAPLYPCSHGEAPRLGPVPQPRILTGAEPFTGLDATVRGLTNRSLLVKGPFRAGSVPISKFIKRTAS